MTRIAAIVNIITNFAEDPPATLDPGAGFAEQLRFDSLDLVEFQMALEDDYRGLIIDDNMRTEQVLSQGTVTEVAQWLDEIATEQLGHGWYLLR